VDLIERFTVIDGRRLAYLDSGGDGPTVLALHGHFSRGRAFAPLAKALSGRYRVVAPDQRAHGRSGKGGDLSPGAYVRDAARLLRELDAGPAAVLGHSMGGIVAYRLAAAFPELGAALVVVDIGTANREPEVQPVLDVSDWPRRAPSRAALAAAIEERGVPSWFFMDSAAEFDDGWGLLFDADDMMASQRALIGDHMAEWASSRCPALLLRGTESFMLSEAEAARMARARPDVEVVPFPGCGHWLYAAAPERFAQVVGDFLDRRLRGSPQAAGPGTAPPL